MAHLQIKLSLLLVFGMQGQTALHYAAKLGGNAADHAWLVTYLLHEGA